MGQKCSPYNLKCWNDPTEVVDATGGECAAYKGWELWHKPCSCIPSDKRPENLWCDTANPSKSCGFPIPAAVFRVQTYKLSPANRVLNIQRHIHEYGPVYICHGVSDEFQLWDWKKHPVFTGKEEAGQYGHAVVAVGWGKHDGTDHWLLRNSWGDDFADKGYYMFQRGIDLHGIESDNIAAPFPVEGYQEATQPECEFLKGERLWDVDGTELVSYYWYGTFKCEPQGVLWSWLSAFGDPKKKVKGENDWAMPDKPARIKFDLHCQGFGLKEGDLKITLKFEDRFLNIGDFSHDVTIPAIPGVKTIRYDYNCEYKNMDFETGYGDNMM